MRLPYPLKKENLYTQRHYSLFLGQHPVARLNPTKTLTLQTLYLHSITLQKIKRYEKDILLFFDFISFFGYVTDT